MEEKIKTLNAVFTEFITKPSGNFESEKAKYDKIVALCKEIQSESSGSMWQAAKTIFMNRFPSRINEIQ